MKKNKNNWWYSIILILLIIWFLLFLWVWIFSMILNDLKDNRAMWDNYKAYAWAESASELALLQIKKNWYAYYDKVDHNVNNRSIILSENPLNIWAYNWNKDVMISYNIWSKVNDYSWTLEPLEYDIVPLFYINDSWEQKISNLIFSIDSWIDSNLAWNIIWNSGWLAWTWSNTGGFKKNMDVDGFKLSNETINNFISSSDSNYFVLFNSWDSWDIKYNIKSTDPAKFFSKPKTSIVSSAQVWNYKQNLNVDLNNTEFLNILKYSIFSN